jgi:hypothetical protein
MLSLCLALVSLPSVALEVIKDGESVVFVGKVWRETFPGPPNYESIDNGDEPETAWILTVDEPRYAMGEPQGSGSLYELKKISRFQLVLTPDQYKKNRSLLERRAEVKGQLFEAHTGHHHTRLLIQVKEIGPARGK